MRVWAPAAQRSPMTASQPSSFSYRKVLFNIGALTSGVSLARVLAAIAVVLLARQVGPTAFGQYAASMTLAKLSATLFSLGLDSLLLRNSGRANSAQLAELTTTTLSIKLGLGLLWLFAITLIAPQINSVSFPQDDRSLVRVGGLVRRTGHDGLECLSSQTGWRPHLTVNGADAGAGLAQHALADRPE